MPAGSIVDYGNQLFEGLNAGVYKFQTEGLAARLLQPVSCGCCRFATAGEHDDVVEVDALQTGPSIMFLASRQVIIEPSMARRGSQSCRSPGLDAMLSGWGCWGQHRGGLGCSLPCLPHLRGVEGGPRRPPRISQ